MTQTVEKIIEVVGQLGLFSIAAYWIQKQIDKSSSKRLEEYKTTLTMLQTKETSLHTKRLEIIETLYKRLVDLDFNARAVTNPVKYSPPDFEKYEAELVRKANDSFQDFHLFYEQNKIYFTLSTCNMIDKIRDAFYNALWDYNQHKILKVHGIEDKDLIGEAYKKVISSYRSIKDDVPTLRAELENEFRKILIVN